MIDHSENVTLRYTRWLNQYCWIFFLFLLQIRSSSHPIATITLAQITLGNSALIDLSTNNTNSDYIKQVIEYNKRIMQQIDKITLVNEYDMMINNSYFKLISNIKIRQSIYVKRVQYSMIKKLEMKNIWTYGIYIKRQKRKINLIYGLRSCKYQNPSQNPGKNFLTRLKKNTPKELDFTQLKPISGSNTLFKNFHGFLEVIEGHVLAWKVIQQTPLKFNLKWGNSSSTFSETQYLYYFQTLC